MESPRHPKKRGKRKPREWIDITGEFNLSTEDPPANSNTDGVDTQSQSFRSMNMNPSQPGARQTSRLQNIQKTDLGNGSIGGGWGFGAPSSGSGFGGLGAAPGLGQARPGQLSGFAQVMGGGGGQGPIDMR